MKVKDLCIVALAAALLFIQEQALSLIPNVQLTIMFVIVYARLFDIKTCGFIVFLHVLLDSIVNGSFLLFLPEFIGLAAIPIGVRFIKTENIILMSLFAIGAALFYSWLFVPPFCLLFEMNVLDYLIMDLPYEGMLAASSFISVLILYKPLKRLGDVYVCKRVA